MVKAKTESAKTGGDSNIMAVLAYFFCPISSIILYLVKKDDSFVKFHCVQSILTFVVGMAVFVGYSVVVGVIAVVTLGIGGILFLLTPFIGLVFLVLWLFLMWKAYSGEKYKLPVLGNLSEQYSK
jgi:uncharacterized membrane protein